MGVVALQTEDGPGSGNGWRGGQAGLDYDGGSVQGGRQLGGPGRAAGGVAVSSSPGLWLEHVNGAWGCVGLRQRGPGGWRADPVLSLVVTRASPGLVAQPGWEAGWPPCVLARDKDGR